MSGFCKTRDGITIHAIGDRFVCSNGDMYTLVDNQLFGPGGVVSRYCDSMSKARDIIVEKHGGIKYE